MPSPTQYRQPRAGAESLAAWVETELKRKLARFRDQITRIEVHLSDINGERVGGGEKRCLLETRLTGRQPVAVATTPTRWPTPCTARPTKILRALDSALGKVRKVKAGNHPREGGL
ncbi:MAG: HPF/RaiA family ribosome-associated protein [Betaproteobacteria bacterium]|nr:HPF/RaiA family ribosome-associated protein [Betaproteobacteria bacterium]